MTSEKGGMATRSHTLLLKGLNFILIKIDMAILSHNVGIMLFVKEKKKKKRGTVAPFSKVMKFDSLKMKNISSDTFLWQRNIYLYKYMKQNPKAHPTQTPHLQCCHGQGVLWKLFIYLALRLYNLFGYGRKLIKNLLSGIRAEKKKKN